MKSQSQIEQRTSVGLHGVVLRWDGDIAKAGQYDYRILRHKTRTGRNSWDTQWSVVFTGGRLRFAVGGLGIGAKEIGMAWSKEDARKLAQEHWNAQNVAICREEETSPFQHVVPGPERGGDGLPGAAQRAVPGDMADWERFIAEKTNCECPKCRQYRAAKSAGAGNVSLSDQGSAPT